MRHFTFFFLLLAFLAWNNTDAQVIIASQDFNSLSDAGTFTVDELFTLSTLTNSGSSNIGGAGLDFASRWNDTRGVTKGPVTTAFDGDSGDFIGVNSFSGGSAPDVAPDGTAVASGTEHNFEFNDTDGALDLNFEAVDLSGFSNRKLSLEYWINNTGFESTDEMTISLSDGNVFGLVALHLDEPGLEANVENGEGLTSSWKNLTVDLEAFFLLGLNPTNVILTISVDNNSSIENIFVDDIVFSGTSGCSELFISEYVEGSSFNKCIEIYNPTSSAINLGAGGYQLKIYFNGSGSAGSTINLTGTVASGDVYVVCHSSASTTLKNNADLITGSLSFNGDDAVELSKSGTPIDVIGKIGQDPGSQWGSGLASTKDNTIRRKSGITMGDSNGSDAFDPSTEWDGFANNTFGGIGSHMSICIVPSCSIDNITRSDQGGCQDNGTPYYEDDVFTTDITVSFSNAPSTGNLVIEEDGTTVGTVAVSALSGSSYTFDDVELPADGSPLTLKAYFTADSGCQLTKNLGAAPQPCSTVPACSYLFISEYVEGSGFNKCIEIYNPTGVSVNLSSYGLFLSFNGGTFENTLPLSGTVASGEVFVICHSSAASQFQALADQISGSLNFNGNDAVLLRDPNGTIDALGQLGNTSNYAQNVTIRRLYSVLAGDSNPFDAFNLSQWQSFPQNTEWGLGYHGTPCVPALPQGWSPNTIGCDSDDGSVNYNQNTAEWTLTSSCYTGPPTSDAQTFAHQTLCGNGTITAHLKSYNTSSGVLSGWAGVSMRETMSPGSKHASLFRNASPFAFRRFRMTTNGPEANQQIFRPNANWLRVERSGNYFRGYTSTNGSFWKFAYSIYIPMGNCIEVGLVAESYNSLVTVTAVFDNVSVSSGMAPLSSPLANSIEESTIGSNRQGAVQVEDLNLPGFPSEEVRDLVLYPNPAKDKLYISLSNWSDEPALISVLDLNGRRIFLDRIDRSGNSFELDLSSLNLSPGVYILSVNTGGKVINKRFVKN